MTDGQPTDAQIALLASGDAGAWRRAVTWLQPRLDGFFIAGGAADHEALTQETFLRMSRSIARFTNGGANELAAWAFAIARTTRIDTARRAAVRPKTIPESQLAGGEGDTPITHAAPDDAVPHDEQFAALDRVEGLFAQLTDQQAELLRLRIHGDVTLELAARTLGMELGAAKQLQRRALRRLAVLLADEDDGDSPASDGRDDDSPTQLLPGRTLSGTPP